MRSILDNLSQKTEEKENNEQNIEPNSIEDIQFEEVGNIDEIQKKLQEKIYEREPAKESLKDFELENNKRPLFVGEKIKESEQQADNDTSASIPADSNAKKYVIYIDTENINFMENLSTNERRLIINKILKEQNSISIKEKELNQKKRFLKHAILACLTFIIGFPLIFICVNKSLLTTIDNYQQAKENFRKLYKEHGRVQLQEPGLIKNIKY